MFVYAACVQVSSEARTTRVLHQFIHSFIFETGSHGADFGPQLAEDDLTLLMLLPSGYWDCRCVPPCLVLFGAGDGTQGVTVGR